MSLRSRTIIAVIVAIGALISTPALAVSQRTFVRSDGVDSNPCSLVAPCRSFGAAMAQTASGGEILVLDSAGYGKVTITQAVSIIAPQGVYAGISVGAGDDGVTINAPGAAVVLRNLTINGQGGNTGILILAAARVHVESCIVSAMTYNGLGLFASTPSVRLFVDDSVFRGNSNYGIYISSSSTVSIKNARVERNGFNGVGVDATAPANLTIAGSLIAANTGYGLLLRAASGTGSFVSVSDSELVANTDSGIDAVASGGFLSLAVARSVLRGNGGRGAYVSASTGTLYAAFHDNLIAHNNSSGIFGDGAAVSVTASSNSVTTNSYGFAQANGAVFERFGNNTVRNNTASDLSGTITAAGPL
jgi:hypothetical protein